VRAGGAAAGDETSASEADLGLRLMGPFDREEDAGDLAGADGVASFGGGLEDAGKGSVGEGVAAFDPHEADRRRFGLDIGQDADVLEDAGEAPAGVSL
jgi:hypothetical protein